MSYNLDDIRKEVEANELEKKLNPERFNNRFVDYITPIGKPLSPVESEQLRELHGRVKALFSNRQKA